MKKLISIAITTFFLVAVPAFATLSDSESQPISTLPAFVNSPNSPDSQTDNLLDNIQLAQVTCTTGDNIPNIANDACVEPSISISDVTPSNAPRGRIVFSVSFANSASTASFGTNPFGFYWQEGASENGPFTDIVSNRGDKQTTYTITFNQETAKPYIRLRLVYLVNKAWRGKNSNVLNAFTSERLGFDLATCTGTGTNGCLRQMAANSNVFGCFGCGATATLYMVPDNAYNDIRRANLIFTAANTLPNGTGNKPSGSSQHYGLPDAPTFSYMAALNNSGNTLNFVKVRGLSASGTQTIPISRAGNVYTADVSSLRYAISYTGQDTLSQISLQWQWGAESAADHASWEDIAGATLATYTYNNITARANRDHLRLVVGDRYTNNFAPPVRLTSAVQELSDSVLFVDDQCNETESDRLMWYPDRNKGACANSRTIGNRQRQALCSGCSTSSGLNFYRVDANAPRDLTMLTTSWATVPNRLAQNSFTYDVATNTSDNRNPQYPYILVTRGNNTEFLGVIGVYGLRAQSTLTFARTSDTSKFTYTVDVSNVRTKWDITPDPSEITYQWQSYDGSSWTSPAGATAAMHTFDSLSGISSIRVLASANFERGGALEDLLRFDAVITSQVAAVKSDGALTPQVDVTITDLTNLKDGVRLRADLFPAQSSGTYQWQNSSTQNSGFNDIGSETNQIYTIPNSYDVDAKPWIRVKYTYTPTGGTQTEIFSPPVDARSVVAVKYIGLCRENIPEPCVDYDTGPMGDSFNATHPTFGLGQRWVCRGCASNDKPQLRIVHHNTPNDIRKLQLVNTGYDGYASSNAHGGRAWHGGRTYSAQNDGTNYPYAVLIDRTNTTTALVRRFAIDRGRSDNLEIERDSSNQNMLDIKSINVRLSYIDATIPYPVTQPLNYQWQRGRSDGTWENIPNRMETTTNRSAPTYNWLQSEIQDLGFDRVRLAVSSSVPQASFDPRTPVTLYSNVVVTVVGELSYRVSQNGGMFMAEETTGNSGSFDNITYQWQNSDSANGTYTNINGATAATYELPITSSRPFYRVSVNYSDSARGSIHSTSQPAEILRSFPIVLHNFYDTAAATQHSVVAEVPSFASTLYTNVRYQWQQSATDDGTFDDISSATNQEYVLPNNFDASKPFLRLQYTFNYVGDTDDKVYRSAAVNATDLYRYRVGGTCTESAGNRPCLAREVTGAVEQVVCRNCGAKKVNFYRVPPTGFANDVRMHSEIFTNANQLSQDATTHVLASHPFTHPFIGAQINETDGEVLNLVRVVGIQENNAVFAKIVNNGSVANNRNRLRVDVSDYMDVFGQDAVPDDFDIHWRRASGNFHSSGTWGGFNPARTGPTFTFGPADRFPRHGNISYIFRVLLLDKAPASPLDNYEPKRLTSELISFGGNAASRNGYTINFANEINLIGHNNDNNYNTWTRFFETSGSENGPYTVLMTVNDTTDGTTRRITLDNTFDNKTHRYIRARLGYVYNKIDSRPPPPHNFDGPSRDFKVPIYIWSNPIDLQYLHAPPINITCGTAEDGSGQPPCLGLIINTSANNARSGICRNCGGASNSKYYRVPPTAQPDTTDATYKAIFTTPANEIAVSDQNLPARNDSLQRGYPFMVRTFEKSGNSITTNFRRVYGIKDTSTVGIEANSNTNQYDADLSGARDIFDVEPETADLTYQWQRGKDAAANHADWENIPSETSSSYTIDDTDFVGGFNHIRLVATDSTPATPFDPIDGFDSVGSMTSNIRAVSTLKITSALSNAGELSFSTGTNTSSFTNLTYQWRQSDAANGTYSDISGATNATYTIPNNYDYSKPFVRVRFGYTDSGGQFQVFSQNEIELFAIRINANIFGELALETLGKATTSFTNVQIEWQHSASENGTYTAIGSATGTSYTPTQASGFVRIHYTYTDSGTTYMVSSPAVEVAPLFTYRVGGTCTESVGNAPCLDRNVAGNVAQVVCRNCGAKKVNFFRVPASGFTNDTRQHDAIFTNANELSQDATSHNVGSHPFTHPFIGAQINETDGAVLNLVRVVGIQDNSSVFPEIERRGGRNELQVNVSEYMDLFGQDATADDFNITWQRANDNSHSDSTWGPFTPSITTPTFTFGAEHHHPDGTNHIYRFVVVDKAPASPIDNYQPKTLTSDLVSFGNISASRDGYTINMTDVAGRLGHNNDNNYHTFSWIFETSGAENGPYTVHTADASSRQLVLPANFDNKTHRFIRGRFGYVYNKIDSRPPPPHAADGPSRSFNVPVYIWTRAIDLQNLHAPPINTTCGTAEDGGGKPPCLGLIINTGANNARSGICRNCSGASNSKYYRVPPTAQPDTSDATYKAIFTTPANEIAVSDQNLPARNDSLQRGYPFMVRTFQQNGNAITTNFRRVYGIKDTSTVGIEVNSGNANQYDADLSGARDIFDVVPETADLDYQWQRGMDAAANHASWEDIPSETSSSYTLDRPDLVVGANTYTHIRLVATDNTPATPFDALDGFDSVGSMTSDAQAVTAPAARTCTATGEELDTATNTCIPTEQSCFNKNQIRKSNACANCDAGMGFDSTANNCTATCPANQEIVSNVCVPTQTFCNGRNQIRDSNNACMDCDAGMGYDSANANSCKTCSGAETRTASGGGYICSSVTCSANEEVINSVCVPTQAHCNGQNQIRNTSNACANCPANEGYDGGSSNTCTACSGTEERIAGTGGGFICVPTQAHCNGQNQIRNVNNACENCPANQGYDSANANSCETCSGTEERIAGTGGGFICVPTQDHCNGQNQIRNTSNACENCPANQGYDSANANSCETCSGTEERIAGTGGGFICVPTQQSCNDQNQIRNASNVCENCPANQGYDGTNTNTCSACTGTNVRTPKDNGFVCEAPAAVTCSDPNEERDPATNTCIPTQASCNGQNQRRDSNNACVQCDAGQGYDGGSTNTCSACTGAETRTASGGGFICQVAITCPTHFRQSGSVCVPSTNPRTDTFTTQPKNGDRRHLACEVSEFGGPLQPGPANNFAANRHSNTILELDTPSANIHTFGSLNFGIRDVQTADCSPALAPNPPAQKARRNLITNSACDSFSGLHISGRTVIDCRNISPATCAVYGLYYPTTADDNTQCQACPVGQSVNSDNTGCMPIPPTCSTGQELHSASNTCIPTVASCNANNQIRNSSNVCMDCGVGEGYASNACSACSASERRVAGGGGFVCEACGNGMEATADRSSCIPTQQSCNDNNQIRDTNNACADCGAGEGYSGGSTNTCRTCTGTETRTASGGGYICKAPTSPTCNSEQELHSATNTCIPKVATCNARNQIRDGNNACVSCGNGEGYASNACVACTNTEIRVAGGGGNGFVCMACGSGEESISNTCVPTVATCNGRNQIRDGNNACVSCGNGEGYASNACVACTNTEIRVAGGGGNGFVCMACGSGEESISNTCVPTVATCNGRNQIRNSSNQCVSCDAGQGYDSATKDCRACTGSETRTASGGGFICQTNTPTCTSDQELVGNVCVPTQAFCNNQNQARMSNACIDCPEGTGYDSANPNSCRTCSASERRAAGGSGGFVCMACGANMEPTADKSACIPTVASCNAKNQIRSSATNQCINCNAGEGYASNACNACTNTQMRVADSGGFICQACGANMESTADRSACIPTAASCHASNQIRNSSNVCESCPANHELHSATNTCIPTVASCNNQNQIRNASNICVDCGAGEGYASNACVACTNTQIRVAGGGGFICQACSANMESTADRSACIPTVASCRANNQIRNGNLCESCPRGQVPHSSGTSCEYTIASCDSINQILENGSCRSCLASEIRRGNSCQSCPSGQVPHSSGTSCTATVASCNGINAILPRGGNACMACVAPNNLRNDNECVATCPEGRIPNDNNNQCISGFILTEPEQLEEVDAILNVISAQSALGALGGHLNNIGESFGTGNVGQVPQSYIEINKRRLHSRLEVLGALSAGNVTAAEEGQGILLAEGLAVNDVAVAVSEDEWTAWVQSGWSDLSGTPLIGTNTISYEGSSFGIYGGYDRLVSDNVRLGLSAGRSLVSITAALSAADNIRNDTIERQIDALLPYMEWRGSQGHLRLLGGYGEGDLRIEENGGSCSVDMNTDWKLASLGGEYVPSSLSSILPQDMHIAILGNVMYSLNDTAGGLCGATNIPSAASSGGEWQFGTQLRYSHSLWDGDYGYRLGVDAREVYGDLQDDTAYDLSGGVSMRGGHGFGLHLDGRVQINDTQHNRSYASGRLDYSDIGSWSSSWQIRYDNNSEGLLHRWELGYQDYWQKHSIGFDMHIERRFVGDTATQIGGGAFIWF